MVIELQTLDLSPGVDEYVLPMKALLVRILRRPLLETRNNVDIVSGDLMMIMILIMIMMMVILIMMLFKTIKVL